MPPGGVMPRAPDFRSQLIYHPFSVHCLQMGAKSFGHPKSVQILMLVVTLRPQ